MTRGAATGDAGHQGPRRISDYVYVRSRLRDRDFYLDSHKRNLMRIRSAWP